MKDKFDDLYAVAGCGGVILAILLVFGLLFGVFCFEGWILMLVWNAVAAGMFNLPMLAYWPAVGIIWVLNLISGLLKIKIKTED